MSYSGSYDTRAPNATSQIITLENMLKEAEDRIDELDGRIDELEAENRMLKQLAKAEAMAAVQVVSAEQPDGEELEEHACAFATYVTGNPLVKHSYSNFIKESSDE